MKKLLVVLSLVLTLLFVSCGKKNNNDDVVEKINMSVLTPNGAPAISLNNLDDNYTITKGAIPADLPTYFAKAEYDVIMAPINVGAQLYSKSKSTYRLLSVITWGNLFLASETNISSLSDVTEVEAFGKDTINQSVIEYACEGITFNYNYQNSTQSKEAFLKNPSKVYLIAEPDLSDLEAVDTKRVYKLSIQDLFKSKSNNKSFTQAGCFVKSTVTEDGINQLKADLKASCDLASSNVDKVNQNCINKGILKTALSASAISGSNIMFKIAKDAKSDIEFTANLNLKYFGGGLPQDEFYI